MLLDLAFVKRHLRVDDDVEDTLIILYAQAAAESSAAFLNRNVYVDEYTQAADTDGIVINAAITAAMLLIAGHLYASREDVVTGVSVAKLPNGARHLLQPYRIGLGV